MESELLTLGILFFFAIVGGVIAKRFKQPAVLGLLLVGAIVGPNTLGIVSNQDWIDMIIEFGAILLLFVVGLEFDLSKLVKLGFKGVTIAVLKTGIAFFIGYQTASFFGYEPIVGIFSGAVLSFSSTVVIVKVLEQKAMYNRQETPLLLTVLVIEDVLAVIALIFFSSLQNSTEASLIPMVEHMIIALSTLLIAYFIMLRFSAYLFKWLIKNGSDDITTFLALGFCIGFSILAYFLGLSPSAGAFLAGSIIASLPQAKSFEHAVAPYSLIFSSLFFIAMGTLVNFKSIAPNAWFIVALLVAVIISRFIAVGLVSYVFAGFRGNQIFFSSLAMISVGEFALLIAKQSSGFGMSIDIVTITSVIIFATAVIMSISVASSSRVSDVWSATKTPTYLNNSFSQLATYVRSFFDQIDTENAETKKFKTAFFGTAFSMLLVAYIFVGWDKGIGLAYTFELATPLIYLIHAGFTGITIFALLIVYKKVRHTQETIVRVLTGMDRMMNHKKSQRILQNMFFVSVFFVSALFFPLIMYIAHLPAWTNIVSFVLLGISFTFFNLTTRVLSTYKTDNYASGRLYNGISLQQLYKSQEVYRTAPKGFAEKKIQ